MDLAALQEKINNYITVVSSWVRNVGKLYFSGTAEDVTVQMIDDDGNVVDTTLPNVAQFRKRVWDDVGGAIGQFDKVFYVDATNGSDNNVGTNSATPFKTIKKACDSVPVGGYALIYLLGSSDFIIDNDIKLYNKFIYIHGTYLDAAAKPVIRNIAYSDAYGNATKGFYIYKSILQFTSLTIQTAQYIDTDAGDSYYQGLIKRYGAGYGKVIIDGSTVYVGDTPFVRQSDRQCIDLIVYDRHRGFDEDYSIVLNGENKNALFVYNENGAFSLTATNIILGSDKDGNDLLWSNIVSGIIKDADSGNPINLISNINFSS